VLKEALVSLKNDKLFCGAAKLLGQLRWRIISKQPKSRWVTDADSFYHAK
jgi:hypothetical protein